MGAWQPGHRLGCAMTWGFGYGWQPTTDPVCRGAVRVGPQEACGCCREFSKQLLSACFLSFFFSLRRDLDFLKYIFIDYAITVVPFPPPLHSILPIPSLPHSPPIAHVHGSYFSVLWLLHFLHYSYPPPVYFPPIIYATYFLYLSPALPLPLPY